MGIKVGDDAKTALKAYSTKYKRVISRHTNEELEGWFHIGDEAIIIFDFNKSDSTVVNSTITPDSIVDKIILAYWKHYN